MIHEIIVSILALIPPLFLAWCIYKKDKLEKEPFPLLAKLFGAGAFAVIPAILAEFLFALVLRFTLSGTSLIYALIDNFIAVALVEEFVKWFCVRTIAWNDRAFDYRFDGIVYAVMVSLGFAAVENVSYVVRSGMGTLLLRALLAVPTHCFSAVFMGYFLGEAKAAEAVSDDKGRSKCIALSLIVPVLLHGAYDFLIDRWNIVTAILFFIFVIALDTAAILRINRSSREDSRIGIPWGSSFSQREIVPSEIPPEIPSENE